jgi:lipoprotein signal peptidase
MQVSSAAALSAAAGVLIADQTTKALSVHTARNPAYTFGVIGGPAPRLIVVALAVVAAFAVIAFRFAPRFGVPLWSVALILAGSMSNTIDRIRFGSVRDFIVTPWAITNIADFAVVGGVITLVVFAGAQFRGAAPR